MITTENAFLGKGWTFPPSFNNNSKQVEMTEGEPDIENSLRILLSTAIGERVMQPKFGCDLNDLVLESLDISLQTEMKSRIETALLYFEPRIDVQSIELFTRSEIEGQIIISLSYIIRSTNTRTNLVFPFYLSEGTEQ
jgi:phage baseplate assembly protein W